MGAGSRRNYAATLPSDRFHCLLDELPLHLVPRRLLRARFGEGLPHLFLNPRCSILPPGQVPAELETRQDLLQGFYLENMIAWVPSPLHETLNPFWLGPWLTRIVSDLRPGDPAPASIPENARYLLAVAGILIPEKSVARQPIGLKQIARKGEDFREKGYAPVSDLIHPFHISALRRYYRRAIRRGVIRLGDEQSSRRYVAHNESVARFFHYQIASAISAIVGEPVKPSYVYMASYLSGAELKKHVDRMQCEFSVTLCLDFSPEPELATSWPIHLDTPEGRVTIYQALGDGLVYRGTRVPHYRHRLSAGHTSTSIFFHYVSEDFSGPLD